MIITKTMQELKDMSVSNLRRLYITLAEEYDNLANSDIRKKFFCHCCGEFHPKGNFFPDERNASGLFYICKDCISKMVDSKDEAWKLLSWMDLPYIDDLYETCLSDSVKDGGNDVSPIIRYLSMVCGLKQYHGLHYKDSVFPIDMNAEDGEKIRRAIKRFGNLPNDDLIFLENEYQDWIGRYECQTKAQETLFEMICLNRLDANKLRKDGKSTKDLDKTLQDILNTLNIQPKQNAGSMDAMSEAHTLGTLIQKWESTRPIPDVDEELKDVDKIGLYIDAFYRGHMSKMLGIPNKFSHIYEKVMDKYTVKKPERSSDEDEDNEVLFDQIFSNIEDY